MNKKELRSDMISKLNRFSSAEKLNKESSIYKNLEVFLNGKNFKSVGIVLSMSHELDTWPIIDTFIGSGVKVYGPKCDYKTKDMNFYEIRSRNEISTDEKNILIPDSSNDLNNQMDLLIVPGLIFNEEGFRTGYGGGFYDRFLEKYFGETVSLLFDEQFGDVIVESHDLPVDILITPTKIINAKEIRKDGK
ncbi:5-formyltetrahydrofolate cyclo-ligase [Phocicoccus pinnipedialis]|nr:5-formyltetrahydrofolate cyclo-ligase [Jeotgalicoccus pinnipedialis]